MKKLHPYLLLCLLCAFTTIGFAQTVFTPATNLQIDVINNAGMEVSWTQGTNVLDYSIEFILDGTSMGVTSIPATNSYASYYNPPSVMVGVDEIEVILISRGINDGGTVMSVAIKAFITVDEVYDIEDFDDFCEDFTGKDYSQAYVKSTEFETYFSIPCICQTVDHIKDGPNEPHVYYVMHNPDYMQVVSNPNGFYFSDVIFFLNDVSLLQQEECEVLEFNDDRSHSGKKEEFDPSTLQEIKNVFTYQNANSVIIKNVDVNYDQQLYVLDITGKILQVSVSYLDNQIVFDKTTLSKGIYFVKLVGSNQVLFTEKILID